MVGLLPGNTILRILEFLPLEEIARISETEQILNQVSRPVRADHWYLHLVDIYQEYQETTGVDPEVSFGPLPRRNRVQLGLIEEADSPSETQG